MKKLFFAICFNLIFFCVAEARITPVSGYTNIKQEIIGEKDPVIKNIDREEVAEFILERFKTAEKIKKEDVNRTVSHVESRLETMQKQEDAKNFFQKVYEKAIKKINEPADVERNDVSDEILEAEFNKRIIAETAKKYAPSQVSEEVKQWNSIGVPVISTLLPPYNIPVHVPAIEHIPLLMNNIDVLSNGMIKFEETVVVVADNQKLKSGLTKILPSRIINEKGKVQNIDYSIIEVTINDVPVKYSLAKNKDRILMVPDKDYRIAPGIYTYKFQYLADNALIEDKDLYKFYWNVGGNGWNLVVDRTITNLTIPDKEGLLGANAMIGSSRGFYPNSVTHKQNTLSTTFVADIPLFVGNGMFIDVDIDKKVMSGITIGQRFVRSFYNYGDIYISFIGLLFIAISSFVSWRYISSGKSRVKVNLNKTALMMRYMLCEKFDKKSIGGFLLDMYKKNIIDIQKTGDTILIIKSTDILKSLAKFEKKALKCLFPSHETTFTVNKNNKLPLKRFVAQLEKGLKKDVFMFNFKLNIGYLLFNLAMIVFAIAGIASFKISSLYVFKVAVLTMFVSFIGTFLWYCGRKKWLKYVTGSLSVLILLLCLVIYSALIHPLAALFLIFGTISTVYSIKLYSKRNGLIGSYINDIAKQKEHIIQNKDNISLSKGFLQHQSMIYICDLDDEIKPSVEDDKYKISIVNALIKCL